jgi:hypothetical protein
VTRAGRLLGVALVFAGGAWLARRGMGQTASVGVTVEGAPPGDLSGARPLADRTRQATALASSRLVAPAWEPSVLAALARWTPPAPVTPTGRALSLVWAGPLSLAGWLLAVVGGTRPRRRDGVWVAAPAGGLFTAWFVRRGLVACTLGQVIVAARQPGERLLAHELTHVRQAERLGPLMGPLYLALMAVYGYARHPMERAARQAARG